MLRTLLLASALAFPIAAQAQSVTSQAMTASAFLDTLGANSHLGWSGAYATLSSTQKAVAYLGIHHLRDGVPLSWTVPSYVAMAAAGVKFDFLPMISDRGTTRGVVNPTGDMAIVASFLAQAPGSVDRFEGPNEFNTNDYTLNGAASRNNLAWGKLANQAYRDAMKANPAMAGVAYIGATTANVGPDAIAAMGDQSGLVDFSSWHTYFGNGGQPMPNLTSGYLGAKKSAPSKPMIYTEAGCSTYNGADGWGACGDDATAQKQVLNTWFDAVKLGAAGIYFYELLNNNVGSMAAGDREGQFGLFDGSGSPKPAAVALHNVTQLLADPGKVATLGSLSYTLAGAPQGLNQLLLQKSTGDMVLALWAEPAMWNGQAIVNPPSQVTVTLPGARQSLIAYDPMQGIVPTQIATASNADRITVPVSDHVVLVQIGAAPYAPPPPAPPPPVHVYAPAIVSPDSVAITQTVQGVGITDTLAGTDARWVNIWANGGTIGAPAAALAGGTVSANGQDIYLWATLDRVNALLGALTFVPTGGPTNIFITYGFGNQAVTKSVPIVVK